MPPSSAVVLYNSDTHAALPALSLGNFCLEFSPPSVFGYLVLFPYLTVKNSNAAQMRIHRSPCTINY
jgi:hypothetical protein